MKFISIQRKLQFRNKSLFLFLESITVYVAFAAKLFASKQNGSSFKSLFWQITDFRNEYKYFQNINILNI